MNRMIKIAVLAMFASLLVLVGASPAMAEDGTHHVEATVAFDGAGPDWLRRKEVREQVRWDKQNDGTGIVLEFLDTDAIDGCFWFPPVAYKDVNAGLRNSNTGNLIKSWDWGSEFNCDWTKNFDSIRGPDNGSADFNVNYCVGDNRIWFRWRLYGGGGSDLLDKGHSETQSCKDA